MTFYPIVLGSGLAGYNFLTETRETQQANFDKNTIFDRDVQAFKDQIGSISTAEELVNNRQLLQVALGAFGLEDDIDNKAFIQKVLESDPADSTSFANRLGDKTYLSIAETFGFNSSTGPQLPDDGSTLQLDGIESVDDLLSPLNRSVLRGALEQFGLKGNENNTFFLRQVLESDLTDESSFVNRLTQPAWADFAAAIGFDNTVEGNTPMERFINTFDGKFDDTLTAEDLVNDPRMLSAATEIFGITQTDPDYLQKILESDPTDENSLVNIVGDERLSMLSQAFRFGWPDIDDLSSADDLINNEMLLEDALATFDVGNPGDDLLRDILNSDLSDPASVANQPSNAPWLEMAEAFQNGWPDTPSPAQTFVELMLSEDRLENLDNSFDVVFDLDVYDATMRLYGQEADVGELTQVKTMLDADLSASVSALTFSFNTPLKEMAKAFAFTSGDTGQNYPEGFADAITRNYLDRQFESSVGDTNTNLRLALSLERELTTVATGSSTGDAQIYSVLASSPLRTVFETAFQLPSAFSSIDIDQQHSVLKARMESQFGVSEVSEFLEPENLEALRNRFLTLGALSENTTTTTSPALMLLTGQ
ncbi:DUF1217 domain-containing protein [Aliishimia ponticola]|uniref:DUF1217 domain-containing protein n=1 Tax=Aliishimia ponticola TaxID=2499833 RepID=A0A4V3XKZ3_9RHOB|nr:DUF1217 domain-containing protein [Aliishimia ponticola]THH38813.1 DUF1217 domain-containing protein [Aliishimia ponticola]